MKKHCQDCTFNTPTGCSKNSKNGYNNCAKYRAIPIYELEKERTDLLISGDNSERLKILTQKIQDLNGWS
jgi:hypothetical protein